MCNQQQVLVPLFPTSELSQLLRDLKKMATNKARVVTSTAANKRPHCDVLTSVARLLGAREVCGCLYLREDGSLWLSTNKNVKQGQFRHQAAAAILELVRGHFTTQATQKLLQVIFDVSVKAITKRYQFILREVPSVRELIFEKDNWNNISLLEISQLIKDLKDFRAGREGDGDVFQACTQVLVRLIDAENICSKLAQTEYAGIRSAIVKGSLGERYDSTNGLHCELAVLEREIRSLNSEALASGEWLEKISEAAKKSYFTVSKFCCHLCYLVFKSFEDSYEETYTQKGPIKLTEYLGNSNTLYPSYESCYLPKGRLTEQVSKHLHANTDNLLQQVARGEYIIREPDLIENSEALVEDSPGAKYIPRPHR